MNTSDRKIADVLAKFGEPMAGNVWRVQGTAVIYHKALERIAAFAKITFDPPTVIRSERDEAVILVTGRMGERSEWSIGEALIGANYRVSGKQAAYVYAMAEKRAKDRVILKLIELSGEVYSEEEADDFRNSAPDAAGRGGGDLDSRETSPPSRRQRAIDPRNPGLAGHVIGNAPHPEEASEPDDERSSSQRLADEMIAFISSRPTVERIEKFEASPDYKRDFALLDDDDKARVMRAKNDRKTAIQSGMANLQAG